MIRARLVFAFLTVMAGYTCPSKAQVPGFQGTVNNYGVGMNPDQECRHPSNGHPACSQWFRFKFQAFNDGTVLAPFTITNDSMNAFVGPLRSSFEIEQTLQGKYSALSRLRATASKARVRIPTTTKDVLTNNGLSRRTPQSGKREPTSTGIQLTTSPEG
jgi:hypothetical protein